MKSLPDDASVWVLVVEKYYTIRKYNIVSCMLKMDGCMCECYF